MTKDVIDNKCLNLLVTEKTNNNLRNVHIRYISSSDVEKKIQKSTFFVSTLEYMRNALLDTFHFLKT